MPKTSRFAGKIGYTDDGFVWMLIEAQNEAGDPIQIPITFSLKDAIDISNHLREAANMAASKRSAIIMPKGVTIQ